MIKILSCCLTLQWDRYLPMLQYLPRTRLPCEVQVLVKQWLLLEKTIRNRRVRQTQADWINRWARRDKFFSTIKTWWPLRLVFTRVAKPRRLGIRTILVRRASSRVLSRISRPHSTSATDHRRMGRTCKSVRQWRNIWNSATTSFNTERESTWWAAQWTWALWWKMKDWT